MYYMVIDIEMCTVPKQMRSRTYPLSMETIQIGAVLQNEDLEIISNFNEYVCPEHGQINSFIHNLTSIGRSEIENAAHLNEVMQKLLDWLPDDEVRAVSWSETDKNQLAKETEAKGFTDKRLTELFDTWIDCQKTFSEKMDSTRVFPLNEALIIADIVTEGHEHDGFSDACNTALLFAKMEREETLQINPLYATAREENSEHLEYGLGSLFSGIKLDQ